MKSTFRALTGILLAGLACAAFAMAPQSSSFELAVNPAGIAGIPTCAAASDPVRVDKAMRMTLSAPLEDAPVIVADGKVKDVFADTIFTIKDPGQPGFVKRKGNGGGIGGTSDGGGVQRSESTLHQLL